MYGRYIKCSNADGVEATFGDAFAPFVLESADGLYRSNHNVATSENTNVNGSTYYGSTVKMRNIVLTLRDRDDHRINRELLYELFRYDIPGVLTYTEDAIDKKIDYVVESVDVDGDPRSRTAVISLLCPDPFFYSAQEQKVPIAEWNGFFEFEHEFDEDGEVFGYKNESQTGIIVNYTSVSGTGVQIVIEVTGAVTNPSIYNIENNQTIYLGSDDNPLNLIAGDVVTITTGVGNKHIYLTRSGITTEINEYLTEDSSFITLMIGTNTIGFTADSGSEYMSLLISFRYQYVGV